MYQTRKILVLIILTNLSLLSYAQQNISTSSVKFIGTTHSVQAIIGDNFLGNTALDNYTIEQSILSTLSKTVLGFTTENPISLKAFPNPFTSHLQFQFTQTSNYEIIIINSLGREVNRIKTQTDISLKLDHLPTGIYVVKVLDLAKNEINVFEVIK